MFGLTVAALSILAAALALYVASAQADLRTGGGAGGQAGPVPGLAADLLDQVVPAGARSDGLPAIGLARQGERLVAVGPHGRILLSTDGAKTWSRQRSPVATDLVSVRFTGPDTIWVLGHDGVALHSSDGGATWQLRLDGRSLLALLRNTYDARTRAKALGADTVRQEIERAAASSATPGVLPWPLLDTWFVNAQEGYLVGAFGLILHTADGGRHWAPLIESTDNPRRLHLHAVSGRGAQRYIAGEQGLLLQWHGASRRFVKTASPYAGSYFGIEVAARRLVVYGLRGSAYVSVDNGQRWRRINTGISASLVGLVSLSADRFVLVSQRGDLLEVDTARGRVTALQQQSGAQVFAAAEGTGHSIVLAQVDGLRTVPLASQGRR